MPRTIETETERHQEAFRYYVSLGSSRSYADVARHFDVSQNSIQLWARSFDWKRRADEHDAKTARRALELADPEGLESSGKAKARNLRLVKMAMLQLAKSVAGGNVRMTVRDLQHLVRLEQELLDGDGEDAVETGGEFADFDGMSVEEVWAAIHQEVEAIERIAACDAEVKRLVADGTIRSLPRLPCAPPGGVG